MVIYGWGIVPQTPLLGDTPRPPLGRWERNVFIGEVGLILIVVIMEVGL